MQIKLAQINIADIDQILPFRKSSRPPYVYIMSDVAFERFLSAFKKAHEALAFGGASIDAALSFFVDSSSRKSALEIIERIGQESFKAYSWDELEATFRNYRSGATVSTEQEGATPIAPNPSAPMSIIESGEYQGLTYEQADIVTSYKNMNYGNNEIIIQNVVKMIERMIGGYRKINDPRANNFTKSLAMSGEVEASQEVLQQWADEAKLGIDQPKPISQEQSKQDKKNAPQKTDKIELVKAPEDSAEKDGKEEFNEYAEEIEDDKKRKTFGSTVSDEEALKISRMDIENDEYFSIIDGILEVNVSAFNLAYNHAKYALSEWARNVVEKNGDRYIRPSAQAKNKLNTIVHGIRVFDYNILMKFSEYINELNVAIESASSKQEQSNLISIKKNLLAKRVSDLETNLMSYRLSQDSTFADSIATPLLYAASFYGFINMVFAENKFINSKRSSLPQAIKSDPESAQAFVEALYKRSTNGISSSFKKFWRLDIRDLNPETSKDLLSYMNISSDLYLSGATADVSREKGGTVSVPTYNCPTCYKVIDLTTKSKKNMEELDAGYDVLVYAPYKKTFQGYDFLTEDSFKYSENGDLRTFAPPGQEYLGSLSQTSVSTRITEQIINDMDGSHKSWDEINSMINSDSFKIQRDGVIRRSEAYRALGAVLKGQYNIAAKKSLCPSGLGKSGSDSNTCGLSMVMPDGATRAYNLQPTWNKTDFDLTVSNGKTTRTYNHEKFDPSGWSNENLIAAAKAKASGGFKFSKIMFGCPCHINKIDEGDDNLWKRHTNIAFKISNNAFPPTLPSGTISTPSFESQAYVVCSANVSLSSVDRDPNSKTFILKYLKELYLKKSDLFITLIDFLLVNGFDDLELLQMIEDISINNDVMSSGISKESSLSDRIKNRLAKLEEIITKHAVNIGKSDVMTALKEVTLVCPFGHKFTIEQSLKFGDSHGSFKINSQSAQKQYSSLIFTEGKSNYDAFKQFLVPYNESGTQKAAYYDEWIKLDESVRKMNFYKQKAQSVVLLKFNIDGVDYVLNKNIPVRQSQIWSGLSSRKQDVISEDRIVRKNSFTFVDSPGDIENISNEDSRIISDGGTYHAAKTEWEAVMSQILDYNTDEDYVSLSPAIPGGSKQYQSATNLIANMDALSRALSGAFNIINTWTSNLIHEKFGESLGRKYLQEESIRKIADIIFEKVLVPIIDFEYVGEDEEDSVAKAEILIKDALSAYKDMFSDIFVDNVYISSVLRKGQLSESETAKKIVSDAISEFISKYENINLPEDIVAGEGIENVSPALISQEAEKIIKADAEPPANRFAKAESIGSKIIIFDQKTATQDVQGFGKLTLVAYARFIANAIFKMQQLFFAKSSPLYIGYNPLMTQYSSPEDILRISAEDVERINVTWGPKNNLIDSEHTIYDSLADVDEYGAKYLLLINKAYQFLDVYIQNSRTLAITPNSIESAKLYIEEELGDKYLAEYIESNPGVSTEKAREAVKKRQALVSKALPIYNSNFKNLVGTYEINVADDSTITTKYSPFNVFPYFQMGKQKKEGELDHPFYSKLNIETDEKTGRKILVEPETGYNSGKLQAGFICRPTVRTWPLPRFGYYGDEDAKASGSKNAVGFPIPFFGDYTQNTSELKDALIFNIRPVVEIPTQIEDEDGGVYGSNLKVDINFLLERGYSREHFKMMYHLQDELKQIKDLFKKEMERINSIESTHPKLIAENEEKIKVLNDLIRRNESRPGYKNKVLIDRRQLDVLTGKQAKLNEELNGIQQLNDNLNSWYKKNIERIQKEYSSMPISLNTKKDFYHMKDQKSNLHNLDDGPISNRKGSLGKLENAAVLHVGIADPIFAYNLIMTQEFHGNKYINLSGERIPNEEVVVKNALIDFIVSIYNLDQIAKLFVKANENALKNAGYDINTFSGRDLLIGTAEGRLSESKFGKINYETGTFMPGKYYNLSLEDSSISMYASDSGKGAPPTYKELFFATKKAKTQGITRAFEDKKDTNNLVTVSHRAADAMSRYIKTVTKGNIPESDENSANDQMVSTASKYYEKILKRASYLRRIMMKQAESIIDPAVLLS